MYKTRVVTNCCCGVDPGPPIVSVCLRARWTVGCVKEQYLKYESAGDQLVGQSLTGVNPQLGEFSTLPCFFHSLNQEEREKVEQLAKYCFPSQNQSFTHTGVMLLTNFIHNEQWLKGNTHENSLLLTNSYFSFVQIFPDTFNHVATICPQDSRFKTPVYTGIPLHCSILNKLN